jgi:DNA polymerase
MTAEGKTQLALFLDLAGDYLGGGYRGPPRDYVFADEPKVPHGGTEAQGHQDTAEQFPPPPCVSVETAAPAAAAGAGDSLELIAVEVRACTACPLCKTRTNGVPGEGVERPLVMVVGEGPGADEDAAGRPFVGKAGKLLDDMLAARGQLGLYRDKNCFIANVVKCRPPENRDPLPEETAACVPFLARQIALLKPLVILTVGRVSTRTLLNTEEGIGKLRGRFHDYHGIPLLPTYHPSALLRNEELKGPAWEDLKRLRAKLSEPGFIPPGFTDFPLAGG